MATVAQIISRIDNKIYDLIDNPGDIASYRIGDKQVNRNQILQELRKLREAYVKIDQETPYEDIRHIAMDFSEFGEELIEFVGDEVT